jgi:hypothetical protein
MRLGALFPVFFHEFIDPSRGIHKLLLSRKKRMALGTNLDPDAGLCGTGMNGIAAGTDYHAVHVFGVNFVFHCLNSLVVTGSCFLKTLHYP